jgi:hypothetical protein
MTTTGHSLFAHIKAMITGWEEVEEGTPVEEWEQAKSARPPVRRTFARLYQNRPLRGGFVIDCVSPHLLFAILIGTFVDGWTTVS